MYGPLAVPFLHFLDLQSKGGGIWRRMIHLNLTSDKWQFPMQSYLKSGKGLSYMTSALKRVGMTEKLTK